MMYQGLIFDFMHAGFNEDLNFFLALFSHIFMHRIIHKMAFGRNIMLTHVHTETKAGKYFR